MKLFFTVPAKTLQEEREAIFSACKQVLPGAYIEIDAAAERLLVEHLVIDDEKKAAEMICEKLAAIGVSAKYQPQQQDPREDKWQAGPQTPFKMKKKPAKTVRLSVFLIALIASVLLVGVLAYTVGAYFYSPFANGYTLGTGDQEGENYAEKIGLIDEMFERYGLYDTDGELLLDAMLKAYALATGDRYAAYYTAEELAAMMGELNGNAVGIGVTVTKEPESENILIIQVMPDSPAARAEVRPGDRIVKIGEESVSELGYDVAVQKMLGEEGTLAEFTVEREGVRIPFSIPRETFEAVTVDARVSTTDSRVGIIRITSFDLNTPEQFKHAMGTLIGAGCDRFVYDVRNNPGGEQKSVMAVLSYFLEEGDVIMSTVNKDGDTTYFYAEPTDYEGESASCNVSEDDIGMYRDYPITVLTNGYTASAAELFTATLSHSGPEFTRIVGENTYGKGVIQSIYDLSTMGFSGGLKLTVGYYAPSSGENYDGEGIAPDDPVSLDPAYANKSLYLLTEQEDAQLAKAIEKLQTAAN